eukprot:tig00021493_g21884.t1
MSPEDKIKKALELKEKGNALYKAGDVKGAVAAYHEIYMYVHGLTDAPPLAMFGGSSATLSDDSTKQVRDLKLSHHLNLSMCHLKLGNWAKVIHNCDKALAIDPSNAKALFRRGKARLQEGPERDCEKAREDLHAAAKLSPQDAEIRSELGKANEACRLNAQNAKETFKFMLKGSGSGAQA